MKLLLNTQKEHVLQRIKEIFEQEEDQDFWNKIDDTLKISIEKGLAQAAKGQVKDHKEVMKKYKRWL